mgnify:CR=1 FL=1
MHEEQPTGTGGNEMFQQLGSITRQLHDALKELGYTDKLKGSVDQLPDAQSRLSYIARLTGVPAVFWLDEKRAQPAAGVIREDSEFMPTENTGDTASNSLEIQVIDDSTDHSADIAAKARGGLQRQIACVVQLAARGIGKRAQRNAGATLVVSDLGFCTADRCIVLRPEPFDEFAC